MTLALPLLVGIVALGQIDRLQRVHQILGLLIDDRNLQ